MRSIVLCCLFVFSLAQFGNSQQNGVNLPSPVFEQLQNRLNSFESQSYQLFEKVADPALRNNHDVHVSDQDYLDIDHTEVYKLKAAKPELLELTIPHGNTQITLSLYQQDIFADRYALRTSEGEIHANRGEMIFYRGVISGDPNSLAIVSFLYDEIRITYSDRQGNHRIHQVTDHRYVKYLDRNIKDDQIYDCFVDENPELTKHDSQNNSGRNQQTGNCVEIYFEVDQESYEDNGSSVPNTEAWVAAIFNEVSTLYENEGVPIAISDILVWTTPDPYIPLGSTSAVLNEFVSQTQSNGYDGRLAHFLSTRGLGGGIAYINVLCSSSIPCAVSASLSTNVVPFPNYSWNVNVVAHELGHNFGSNHTHSCVWNGNGTQIDDCGNIYLDNNGGNPGSCYDSNDPILPAEGGTIMSYCHLNGVGMNFSLGFGDQPGALILSKYQNASCNTGLCAPPICTSLSDPTNGATNVDFLQDLSWDAVLGADGYKLRIGTSPGGSELLALTDIGQVTGYDPGGLPFNSVIYVKIIPYNDLGDADACSEESFTVEANVAPSCTALTNPLDQDVDTETNLILTWDHSVGNQLGYRLTVGYSPGSGEILNLFDVGNVTAYTLNGLPFSTTIHVRITPYGIAGDVNGCTIESFTTKPEPAGDDCTNPLSISCGQSVDGSTIDANFDGAPSCYVFNTAPGIWYSFIGSGDVVTLTTCGQAQYDTKIIVYSGDCAALNCVAGVDDGAGCSGYTTKLVFPTESGITYRILVNGYQSSVGTFTMSMSCTAPLTNDDCEQATALPIFNEGTCPSNASSGTTVGATHDGPMSCYSSSFITQNNGVWYSLNYPTDGSGVQVSISSTGVSHYVALFESCGEQEISCTSTQQVIPEFTGLTAGGSYRLLVYSLVGYETSFTICLEKISPPPCTQISSPSQSQMEVDVNSDVSWSPVTGATGYRVTMGTSPGGSDIADNVDVGNSTTFDPGILPFESDIYTSVSPYEDELAALNCSQVDFRTAACNEVTNTNESGPGSLAGACNCQPMADSVTFSSQIDGQTILLNNNPIILNESLLIFVLPGQDISVSGNSTSTVFDIGPGATELIIDGLNMIAGTGSIGAAIQNLGNLTLRDLTIFQHNGNSGMMLIHNQGNLIFQGSCLIEE